jgi:hypothetical protein
MATVLTTKVTASNLYNYFSSYVRDTSNANIVWGTNNLPFPEMPVDTFGGSTSGKNLINKLQPVKGDKINALTIYTQLLELTTHYTTNRKLRAKLNITGDGGNAPAGPKGPSGGIIFDDTQKANLSVLYEVNVGVTNENILSKKLISKNNIDILFAAMRTSYNSVYRNNTVTLTINVCHASCHSSCHGSRIRR